MTKLISVLLAADPCRNRYIKYRKVPRGCEIVHENDDANAWFIVINGKVEIEVQTSKKISVNHQVAHLTSGHAFGEFGLIYEQQRLATVKAGNEDVILAELTKFHYLKYLKDFHTKMYFSDLQMKLDFISQWRVFSSWPKNAAIALSYLLTSKKCPEGTILYDANETSPSLCFVISGACTVWSIVPSPKLDGFKVGYMLETAERGYFFGTSCTPSCVRKVVANNGEPVHLFIADHIDVELCQSGTLLLHSLHKHKADEQLLIHDRMERLVEIQRDIRRHRACHPACTDHASVRPISCTNHRSGSEHPSSRRTNTKIQGIRACSAIPFVYRQPIPAFRGMCSSEIRNYGSDTTYSQLVTVVFDRSFQTFSTVTDSSDDCSSHACIAQTLIDLMRVEVARALLLPQICVRVHPPEALGERAMCSMVITSADDIPEHCSRLAESLVVQVSDPSSTIHTGVAMRGAIAAFFVHDGNGDLVGGSSVIHNRVEGCILTQEPVHAWCQRLNRSDAPLAQSGCLQIEWKRRAELIQT